jgi:hypothetical protein
VGPQANLPAGESHNTRTATAKHLKPRPTSQPELLEPMDVIRPAGDPGDTGGLTGQQCFERDDFVDHAEILTMRR